MKKVFALALLVLGIYVFQDSGPLVRPAESIESIPDNSTDQRSTSTFTPSIVTVSGEFYGNQHSGSQIQGTAEVIRILTDDNDGSRHQRFIISLPSGQTLLVAHNIDLAPRVEALRTGEQIEFNGEYEWNSQGGVVHWTHHDPQARHQEGWLKYRGQTFK